jgi:chemotaxis-related protein WspD
MVILQVSPPTPGKGSGSAAGAKRLIVMACEHGSLALPVDEVHGIVRYRASDLRAVPSNLAQSATRHTQGVLETDTSLIGVLDTERLSQSIARSLT